MKETAVSLPAPVLPSERDWELWDFSLRPGKTFTTARSKFANECLHLMAPQNFFQNLRNLKYCPVLHLRNPVHKHRKLDRIQHSAGGVHDPFGKIRQRNSHALFCHPD